MLSKHKFCFAGFLLLKTKSNISLFRRLSNKYSKNVCFRYWGSHNALRYSYSCFVQQRIKAPSWFSNNLISNKPEWNNCFIKNAYKISMNLTDFILLVQTGKDSKGLPFFTCHNNWSKQTTIDCGSEKESKQDLECAAEAASSSGFLKAKWRLGNSRARETSRARQARTGTPTARANQTTGLTNRLRAFSLGIIKRKNTQISDQQK